MADSNAIRQANLTLIGYRDDKDVSQLNQQTESTGSSFVNEVGMGALFGLPLMIGQDYLMQSKPVSVWKYRSSHPLDDGSKMSWTKAWETVGQNNKAEKASLEYLKDSNSWMNTYRNKSRFSAIKGIEAELPQFRPSADVSKLAGNKLVKYNNARRTSLYYQEVRKLIEEAKTKKMTGEELKAQVKKIHEAMAKADAKVNVAIQKGLIKPTGKLGKASHWIKSKAGVYKVKGSLLKSVRGSKALRMASKGAKGTAIFAVIEGVMELSDIYNGYKRDRATGNRQLGKSAVKVGASVLGYAAGAAATGAAVGSIFPGVGNVVGGAIWFVGGLIGGWLAGKAAEKATKKVLGESQTLEKSETDMLEDEKSKTEANNATDNIEAERALLTEVAQKAEAAGGFEDQAVLDAYNTILQEREAELGETNSQEGAGGVDTTSSTTSQYDDETLKVLYGLSSLVNLKA